MGKVYMKKVLGDMFDIISCFLLMLSLLLMPFVKSIACLRCSAKAETGCASP
jgi:hypothetical protein